VGAQSSSTEFSLGVEQGSFPGGVDNLSQSVLKDKPASAGWQTVGESSKKKGQQSKGPIVSGAWSWEKQEVRQQGRSGKEVLGTLGLIQHSPTLPG
jgi:hypothetical protein